MIKSLTQAMALGKSARFYPAQAMNFSNYFGKKASEVPEVQLPGEETAEVTGVASYVDEVKSKVPPSTKLKAEIREMERTEEEGNLYSVYKPQRMVKRERD